MSTAFAQTNDSALTSGVNNILDPSDFSRLYPPTACSTMFVPTNRTYVSWIGRLIRFGLLSPIGYVRTVNHDVSTTVKYTHYRTFEMPIFVPDFGDIDEKDGPQQVPSSEIIIWTFPSGRSAVASFSYECGMFTIVERSADKKDIGVPVIFIDVKTAVNQVLYLFNCNATAPSS